MTEKTETTTQTEQPEKEKPDAGQKKYDGGKIPKSTKKD